MKNLQDDPAIQILLQNPNPPTLEDIIKISKKRKIHSIPLFWEFFDRVTMMYKMKHLYRT